MDKEKIGFFGGCFNPPTNIHIDLANNFIKDGILDKVIFVPVGDYYKKQGIIPSNHRINMLNLSCKNNKRLEVENVASVHKEKLYATDTFELIYNKYNNINIYFIMGSDNFQKMPKWKNYDEIIKKYKFIVIERLEHETSIDLKNIIYYKTNQKEDICSTKIRKMIKNKQDVTYLINKDVFDYINQNKLYL